MATQKKELFSSTTGLGSGPRIWPETVDSKLFATGSGTLKKLTPVALNTSTNHFVPWDHDGSNGIDTIRGFVWTDDVELDASDEVIGNIMLRGTVHYDDLPAKDDVDSGATDAEWTQALRDAQDWGLIVQGIPSGT